MLARNTVLNVTGQGLPMVAALVSIPVLIHHLGTSRFGVLTLVWAAIGYFSLFDLGLGRALTQAVAMRLGSREGMADLSEVAWTALVVMTALGMAGGTLLAMSSGWLVRVVFHIPANLAGESLGALYLLALSMPAVVVTAGLRGLLEAHQDFGVATALRVPLALFTFIAPLFVLPFSISLVPIVAVLVVGRFITFAAYLVVCVKRYAYLQQRPAPRWAVLTPLLRLGGWMMASNIASPVMVYLDRFFIGATLAMTAVAHYVTPYEVVTKLLIIPSAMIAVLFPAFATTYVDNPQRTAVLFERSLRILVLLTFPLLLVVILFASEGLTLWVGAPFARESAPVLRWLAVGIFANAVAQAPFAMLQGTGRPDLTAKLHLIELPLYVATLAWLAHTYGIVGVAIAWTLRATLDAIAMLILGNQRIRGLSKHVKQTLIVGTGALGVLVGACFVDGLTARLVFLSAGGVAFVLVGWTRMMQPAERAYLRERAGA
ncbi:MAG: flippase [bacterium]